MTSNVCELTTSYFNWFIWLSVGLASQQYKSWGNSLPLLSVPFFKWILMLLGIGNAGTLTYSPYNLVCHLLVTGALPLTVFALVSLPAHTPTRLQVCSSAPFVQAVEKNNRIDENSLCYLREEKRLDRWWGQFGRATLKPCWIPGLCFARLKDRTEMVGVGVDHCSFSGRRGFAEVQPPIPFWLSALLRCICPTPLISLAVLRAV